MKLDSRPHNSVPTSSLAEYRLRDMAPDSARSGEHRVRETIPQFQKYTAAANEYSGVVDAASCPMPLAKTKPPQEAKRDALNEPARLRFVYGLDTLRARGWSRDRIARYLGCTTKTLEDVYFGHRRVATWMLDALPEVQEDLHQLRLAQLRKQAG
jgi:hypothetical protein